MKMKHLKIKKLLLAALLLPLLFITASCGDPAIEAFEQYEPKIVVNAYLFVGTTVSDIRILRNYPVGTTIESSKQYLTPAQSTVVTINGTVLDYNPITKSYFSNSITVQPKTAYSLQVTSVVDGRKLECSAVTTTPNVGFALESKNLGTVSYNGNKPVISFKPTEGAYSYSFSFRPDSASLDSFIYDNIFESDITREDVAKDFNGYYLQWDMVINIDTKISGFFDYVTEWWDIWFYGPYTIYAYAGDINMRDFLMTATDIQEPDGNFFEPAFYIKGDGIGVFGSAVRDSLTLRVTK